jgi:hypothetical protein
MENTEIPTTPSLEFTGYQEFPPTPENTASCSVP